MKPELRKPHYKNRNIEVPDEIWDSAKDCAWQRRISVKDWVREWIKYGVEAERTARNGGNSG